MIDLKLTVEDDGPLYMQLYRRIRGLILSGDLQDGLKMPSKRLLCDQLSLSKTTVETAYGMLLEEGFLHSKPRSGLFVVNPEPIGKAAAQQDVSSSFKDVRSSDHAIDFSLLAVDGDSFPVRLWRAALAESLSLNANAVHQYGDPKGDLSLRVSLAQYLRTSREVSCEPEQIVIGTGISYSVFLLSRILEGITSIAMEENGIAQVKEIFDHHRFHVIPVPLEENELTVNELASRNIRAVYVTPSHRPSGSPMPYSTRQQLLNWAYRLDGYIIEDDYDGEFRYAGKTIPSLQGLDQKGVVIYMGTFSKAFTPALRMNYMVLPVHLAEKLHSKGQILSHPSRPEQWAMQWFMERGHWYRHIRRMRHLYGKKREKLVQTVNAHFPNYVQINGDSAGLHIEMRVKTDRTAEKLIELAAAEGVRVYGAQNERVNRSSGNPKIYLGFGGVNERDMERGVRLLKAAWRDILGE
ncbi:PLP-dependent aminotransferase family protein [Cohnella sp. CFH 77786]|uniref:MocR-like pyridoxine biosynthesis transcription factor PdxR n=1 Tax=Cohnella sp. CFH 77786 TaxID=2662265 RepID=UPI001C610CEA|nr:PLP-dependent aminotransferase family protein [Cohnella sp. CFH 77786]